MAGFYLVTFVEIFAEISRDFCVAYLAIVCSFGRGTFPQESALYPPLQVA